MEHQPSIYDSILSSKQSNIDKIRKNSQQSMGRQRKLSVFLVKQTIQQQYIPEKVRQPKENHSNITNKKSLNQQPQFSTPTLTSVNLQSIQQNKNILRQKLEQDQRREYLKAKVTPVLNKMLVKIVNEEPQNILDFMIGFLKKQQEKYQQKRFNDKAKNDFMNQQKNFQELFQSTIATKFIKFKK